MNNIEYRLGDLFHDYMGYEIDSLTERYNQINLAHGVNCVGAMGAGIAVSFKRKFPDMYETYKNRCNNDLIIPGCCWSWNTTWSDGHFYDKNGRVQERMVNYNVYNLTIKTHWKMLASFIALKGSLQNLRKELEEKEMMEVTMPWIGCGLGGLPKDSVKKLIEQTFTNSKVKVLIHEPESKK